MGGRHLPRLGLGRHRRPHRRPGALDLRLWASGPDARELLRDHGLAVRARGRLAVAVEHALRGRGHGAVPGRRVRMPTVEDPAPQADDAVSGAGPGPGGVGAGLPFEVNLAVTVPGREPA